MSDEPERLTRTEWEHRAARDECARYGHDWHIMSTLAGPYALVCTRPCDHPGYDIVRRDADASGS